MASLISAFEAALVEQSCLPATRKLYVWWVRKFYAHCRKPASTWTGEDARFWLLDLHAQRYSAVSRKQALCAIVFVFRHVLRRELGQLDLPPFPRPRQTLRTVPSREELARIFGGMRGQARLMAALLYGSGLRVNECCHLRVMDVDFAAATLRIIAGKGDKSRYTILPKLLVPELHRQIALVKATHDRDLAAGGGLVELPSRLAEKYPQAKRELRWQWLFPSTIVRGQYRWHATPESVAKAMRIAVHAAGITQRITPHTLRHAFVTHALENGNQIAAVKDWVGHEDVNTTLIYLHPRASIGVSPLDGAVRAIPQVDFQVA